MFNNKTGKNYYFHNKFNYFFSKFKIGFNVFSDLNIKFKKLGFITTRTRENQYLVIYGGHLEFVSFFTMAPILILINMF